MFAEADEESVASKEERGEAYHGSGEPDEVIGTASEVFGTASHIGGVPIYVSGEVSRVGGEASHGRGKLSRDRGETNEEAEATVGGIAEANLKTPLAEGFISNARLILGNPQIPIDRHAITCPYTAVEQHDRQRPDRRGYRHHHSCSCCSAGPYLHQPGLPAAAHELGTDQGHS